MINKNKYPSLNNGQVYNNINVFSIQSKIPFKKSSMEIPFHICIKRGKECFGMLSDFCFSIIVESSPYLPQCLPFGSTHLLTQQQMLWIGCVPAADSVALLVALQAALPHQRRAHGPES